MEYTPTMPDISNELQAARLLAKAEESMIMELVRELTVERDTFKRMAGMYKHAYEETKNQLKQFQDIWTATHAELMNEKALNGDGDIKTPTPPDLGSDWYMNTSWVSTHLSREHFEQTEWLITKREFVPALAEIDKQLATHISPEARLEGMLLKSVVLRLSSGDKLVQALNQCDEALELCSRHPNLQQSRSKANFYKGLCLYDLGSFPEARIAFAPVSATDFVYGKAKEHLNACKNLQADLVKEQESQVRTVAIQKHATNQHLMRQVKGPTLNMGASSLDSRILSALKQHVAERDIAQGIDLVDTELRAPDTVQSSTIPIESDDSLLGEDEPTTLKDDAEHSLEDNIITIDNAPLRELSNALMML